MTLNLMKKKCMCMYFRTIINKHCGFPAIYLENNVCGFVEEVKYIGVIIHSTMKTTINIIRKTRKIYLQDDFLCWIL